jgi:NnrU protein.
MDPALVIAGLWIAFAGSHMVLSSRSLRPKIVAALGDDFRFQGLYSLVALGIFVPLVTIYFRHKHEGPYLGRLIETPELRWLMYIGMGATFAMAVAGLARPSPASVVPGKAEVRGIYHLTRHPVLMALGLYGFLHLCVAAINATELAFFAGFPLFVLIGARHQDQRKLASNPDYKRFYEATPFLPFSRPSGVLTALREQPLPIALGVAITVALRWFHPVLFGP